VKLVSWNVNGLRAVLKKGFEESFWELGADAFCLQETKCQEDQADLDLPGYFQYYSYAEKKGYSGTAVFTREQPLRVLHGCGYPLLDNEGRICAVEYPAFWLVCVYTPNAQRELTRLELRMSWDDAFRDFCAGLERGVIPEGVAYEWTPAAEGVVPAEVLAGAQVGAADAGSEGAVDGELPRTGSGEFAQPKPVVMCGDFNVAHQEIDLKNVKSNIGNAGFTYEERGKFTELLEAGFTDTFRYMNPDTEGAYSWWSYMFHARENNAGWRIDYFLCSDSLRDAIRIAEIYPDVMGSDHCPVGLVLDVEGGR